MCTLLSIIWFLFGGVWLWLDYMFFGIIAYIFIVTIPADIAPFRIVSYVLWLLGKHIVDMPNTDTGSAFMNIVWFFVAGLRLIPGHVTTVLAQSVTIIGTSVATANIKMIPITCFPSGEVVVADSKATI